jgi:hypothetical protein
MQDQSRFVTPRLPQWMLGVPVALLLVKKDVEAV